MNLNLKEQPLLAKDIMPPKVHTVRPDSDIADALHLMLTQRISGIPLIDEDHRYIGMFSEKCCMRVLCDTIDQVSEPWKRMPVARDFMTRKLLILKPHDDVFEAIAKLLHHRFSGAPIANHDLSFIGVFSEKTSMSVLIEAAYSNIPTSAVWAFANPDRDRIIDENTDLLTVAKIFINTPYRRLPVITNNKIVGQVSRYDVLNHARILPQILRYHSVQPDSTPSASTGERIPVKVHEVADMHAETISPDLDILGIAQRFLNTPYRRFPVLDNGRMVGQVCRRDLLSAAMKLLSPHFTQQAAGLYLSAVNDRDGSSLG